MCQSNVSPKRYWEALGGTQSLPLWGFLSLPWETPCLLHGAVSEENQVTGLLSLHGNLGQGGLGATMKKGVRDSHQ